MKKLSQYLVIWQLGNNEQSRKETAVDIDFEVRQEFISAKEKVNAIRDKVDFHENVYPSPLTIIGIFKL